MRFILAVSSTTSIFVQNWRTFCALEGFKIFGCWIQGVTGLADLRLAIWTGLARNLDEEGQELIKKTGKFWKTGDQGAAGTLVAAFDPALNGEDFHPFPFFHSCHWHGSSWGIVERD